MHRNKYIILEKKLLQYLNRKKSAFVAFNEKNEVILFDNVTLTKDAKEVARQMYKKGYFRKNKYDLYTISPDGKFRLLDLENHEWEPYIPELKEGDLKLLDKVSSNWGTCASIFGRYHYKWLSALIRLTAHGYLECRHNRKVVTGPDVIPEPEIQLNKHRNSQFFRKPENSLK